MSRFLSLFLMTISFLHTNATRFPRADNTAPDLSCDGPPPEGPLVVNVEWISPTRVEVRLEGRENFRTLRELCSSPKMIYAFFDAYRACMDRCPGWQAPQDYQEGGRVIAAIEKYIKLKSTVWQDGLQITCHPNVIRPDWPWPEPRRSWYREIFPTLTSLCPKYVYGIDDQPETFKPFRLGCECREGEEARDRRNHLWCPHRNDVLETFQGQSDGSPNARGVFGGVTSQFVPDFLEILQGHYAMCQMRCTCSDLHKDIHEFVIESVTNRLFGDRAMLKSPENMREARERANAEAESAGKNIWDYIDVVYFRNCQSNKDCTSGSVCTVLAKASQLVLGLSQTTFYATACMVAGRASLDSLQRGRLNGRNVEEAEPARFQESEVDQLCACNSTYVSLGCCGAPDGIVYESSALKRGVLF